MVHFFLSSDITLIMIMTMILIVIVNNAVNIVLVVTIIIVDVLVKMAVVTLILSCVAADIRHHRHNLIKDTCIISTIDFFKKTMMCYLKTTKQHRSAAPSGPLPL